MMKWNSCKTLIVGSVMAVCGAITVGNLPAPAQMGPEYYTGSWPDTAGNFPLRQAYQGRWRVVDPDPNGLNCRASLPSPAGDIDVVTTFIQGDILQAIPRERGVTELVSVQDQTWLRVKLDAGSTCWVRANVQFLEPFTN